MLALGGEHVGHLRRLHVASTVYLGLLDQPRSRVHVRGRREASTHLDHRRLEPRGTLGHGAAPSAASSGSSLPSCSSAWRSSQPPTWVAPMKICGTVMRPFARSTISLLRSQSRPTSNSVNSTPLRFNRALAWPKWGKCGVVYIWKTAIFLPPDRGLLGPPSPRHNPGQRPARRQAPAPSRA